MFADDRSELLVFETINEPYFNMCVLNHLIYAVCDSESGCLDRSKAAVDTLNRDVLQIIRGNGHPTRKVVIRHAAIAPSQKDCPTHRHGFREPIPTRPGSVSNDVNQWLLHCLCCNMNLSVQCKCVL